MSAPALRMVGPQEYFREKVSAAVANLKIRVTDDIEFYVVNLLCDFIAPGKLETVTGELDALETPLAMMLKEAVEAPTSQRLKIFKYLGDTSLYLSGFFQDYFNRKTFDIGYYMSLGSSAYQSAAALAREAHNDEHFSSLYLSMANQFTALVDVVAEVSEVPGNLPPMDVLAIYDRWTRSNSPRLRQALQKVGIIPIPIATRERQ